MQLQGPPRVGVGVLVRRGSEILIGQRRGSLGDGDWALPGGHLEHGETFEGCATREVLEETGIHITHAAFATAQNVLFPHGAHYVTIFVLGNAAEGAEPQLREPDKCHAWKWVEWGELQQHQPLFQPLRQLVDSGYAPA